MARVYETKIWDVYTKQLFSIEQDNKAEAIRLAECAAEASVITWQTYPNLPGHLPAIRYQSIALDVWQDGEWRHPYIHG